MNNPFASLGRALRGWLGYGPDGGAAPDAPEDAANDPQRVEGESGGEGAVPPRTEEEAAVRGPVARLWNRLRDFLRVPPEEELPADGPEDGTLHWQLFEGDIPEGEIPPPPPPPDGAEPPSPESVEAGPGPDRTGDPDSENTQANLPAPEGAASPTPEGAASPTLEGADGEPSPDGWDPSDRQADPEPAEARPGRVWRLRDLLAGPGPEGGEKPPFRWRAWLRTPRGVLIAGAVLLLLALSLLFAWIDTRPPEPVVETTAAGSSYMGLFQESVAADGTILLSVSDDISADYINQNLTVSPRTKFYARQAGNRIEVVLQEYANEPYTLTLVMPDDGIAVLKLNEDPLRVAMTSSANNVRPDSAVTLWFSHPVSAAQVEKHVAVSGVSCDIELGEEGTEVTLRPSRALRYGEEYTLSVSGSLVAENGAQLWDTAYYSFTVMSNPYELTLLNPQAQLIPNGEALTLEFESQNTLRGEMPVVVNLYRFPSLEKYGEQAQALMDYPMIELTMVEKVETFIELLPPGGSEVAIPFPGEGGYLLEIIVDHPAPNEWDEAQAVFRKAVSVTDLSLYMQTGRSQTLAWLNDSVSGGALEGYRIEFARTARGEAETSMVTDSQGLANLFHQADYGDAPEVVRIYDRGGSLVYIDHTKIINDQYPATVADLYYSYFYLDRPLYRPTDEVNFWGFVRPYGANRSPAPTEIEVVFDSGGLDMVVTVPVDDTGVFTGSIHIEQVKSAQYRIMARLPEEEEEDEDRPERRELDYNTYGVGVLDSVWIDVKEYETPDMVISVETDKSWYRWDEEVVVTVVPTFYDGTSLPLFEMEFFVLSGYYGNKGEPITITTDESGVAEVRFAAHQRGDNPAGWGPVQNRFEARISSDGESVSAYGSYAYFPTDIIFSGAVEDDEDGLPVLTLWSSELLTDGISDELVEQIAGTASSSSYREESHAALRGGPVDGPVTLSGTLYYYPIGREERVELPISRATTTEGGSLTLDGLVPDDFDDLRYAYLNISASAIDGQGRPIRVDLSWYNTKYYGGLTDRGDGEVLRYSGYSLDFADADGAGRLNDFTAYLTYNTAYYGDGEGIRMTLLYDGLPVPNEGRVLYTVLQNEIVDSGVFTGNSLTLTQRVEWANSVTVVAAYFDGAAVHPIRDTVVRFNTASIILDLEVSTDKDSYQPGDEMTVTLRATDPDGNGVAGNALVSVVDESIFALKEQYISVMNTLYGDLYFYNTYIKKYTTSEGDLERNHGVTDGGKGGDILGFYDSYRKDFRDTAAFLPLRTDRNGVASATFKLPDNTTSWRISSVAIGDNLYAGSSKDNVISSLPFYIRPVLSNKYIEGDEIAMLVQGHGSLLDAESEIEYTVTLSGDEYEETVTLGGPSYTAGAVNFGELPVGEYVLVATARFSGYSDTVELPITVIPSNLELVVHRALDLDAGLDIAAMRYPVVIQFYNEANEPFLRSLASLVSHYCYRADQRLARYIAKEALSDNLGLDSYTTPRFLQGEDGKVSDLQNSDGGVGWYTGSTSDPVLTAKMAMIVPDQFNRNTMRSYLRRVIEEGDEEDGEIARAAGYLGLAALGEPVQNELELLLAEEISVLERFYLIAAMSFCEQGEERAAALYAEQIAPLLERPDRAEGLLVDYHDPDVDPRYRESSRQQHTAAAWIAATRLGLDDADEIALYLSGGWRINSLFECMYYVSCYDREVAPTSLVYAVDGVEQTLDLGLTGYASLRFNKSQLDALELVELPDNIRAMAYYIGEPDEVDLETGGDFAVSKAISEADNGLWMVEIQIDFGEDAPLGYYDVSEWIPSNTRLYEVGRLYEDRALASPRWRATQRSEGQKLYFQLNRLSRDCRSATLRYYVRPTFDSAAAVDRTYVIHAESGANAATEKSRWP